MKKAGLLCLAAIGMATGIIGSIAAESSASADVTATIIAPEPEFSLTIRTASPVTASLVTGGILPGALPGWVIIEPGTEGNPSTRRAENLSLQDGPWYYSPFALSGMPDGAFMVIIREAGILVTNRRGQQMHTEVWEGRSDFLRKTHIFGRNGTAVLTFGARIRVGANQDPGRYSGSFVVAIGSD